MKTYIFLRVLLQLPFSLESTVLSKLPWAIAVPNGHICYVIFRIDVEKNFYEANALAIVVPDGHQRLLLNFYLKLLYVRDEIWRLPFLCLIVNNNDCSVLLRVTKGSSKLRSSMLAKTLYEYGR